MAEEAERQRIKEELEAKAASEAAEIAKREAERRDDVDVGIAHDESGRESSQYEIFMLLPFNLNLNLSPHHFTPILKHVELI